MPFWLVLLTEHEVLHRYAPNAVRHCLVAEQYCTGLVAPLQQTVDASKFPTLVAQFTQQPSCTIPFHRYRFLIRIPSFGEMFIILFNFKFKF